MRKLFILMIMITAASGAVSAQAPRIGGQKWNLVQLNGEDVSDAGAYLELTTNEKRFSGHTGCNRMFGPVDARGQRIDFSNVGTTRMACGPDRRKQRIETAFVEGLGLVDRFRRVGNTLELSAHGLVMRFVREIQKPATGTNLTGKKWMLDAIKGAPVSTIGRTAFINFDAAKGTAGGNSSCNVFGGNYTTKGDAIKITDVISTMRACIEDERMTIEREFLDGLRGADRYEIRGGKLMLYQGRRLLLTFKL